MKWISLIALITLCSCSINPLEEIEHEQPDIIESTQGSAEVTFRLSRAPITKSCISPDEDLIQDINIYAYRDGKLVEHAFQSSPTSVTMELNKGCTYNFYAIANMGRTDMPSDESQVGSKVNLWIATIDDLDYYLPMAWKTTGINLSGSQKAVNVKLERLAARIGFNLDSSLVNGLKITSVRLCQSASVIRPFEAGGSKITSEKPMCGGECNGCLAQAAGADDADEPARCQQLADIGDLRFPTDDA